MKNRNSVYKNKKKITLYILTASLAAITLLVGIGNCLTCNTQNTIAASDPVTTEDMPFITCEGPVEAYELSMPVTARWQENTWVDNVLMHDKTDGEDYFKRKVFDIPIKRQEVLSVTFLDEIPEVSVRTWDVSADKSGRVVAWVEKNGSMYDLYIAANGGINAAGNACVRLFDNYCNMERITFNGAFHTDYAEDMTGMFSACFKLKYLDISELNTANVVNMNRMFACLPLETIDLSTLDTSKVTDMTEMFADCYNLVGLDLSSFDTGAVVTMRSMFQHSENLVTVNMDGWDTSNVKDMNSMFSGCASLNYLDLTGFDTSKVVDMECMFYGCDALQILELGNWEVDSVLYMGDFYSKNNLPDGRPWTTLFWNNN
ncbi:MAG: BspA family leucine-rich repeat surface protein [Oscillospiraceae bacterium]|nr:BspA family leucine-rich repeat surface protein [Oscillospiraceae bacterium]